MASQLSEIDGGVSVYFVVLRGRQSEDECPEDMWETFQKCEENDITHRWIAEDDCLKMKPEKTDIFVLEKFTGELFDYLQKTKCLILGPQCLLRCFLTNESIPDGTSPIFNTAMRGVVVCFSGLTSEDKSGLQQQVEYMGGICLKQLRQCVTHLVTDSVMSAKYEKATEDNIKVYTRDWIPAVWSANLQKYTPATDTDFDRFKAPVFMNLVVTTTNLSKAEKDEVKRLIGEHGGVFMGPLDGKQVKVLITKEYTTLSEKIKYAMANAIPCLNTAWVHRSIEVGYSLPFSDFLISPTAQLPKSSTPERASHHASLNLSNVSTIPTDSQPNFIDETMSSTVSGANSTVARPGNVPAMERLSIKEAKRAGPFLDGCNIYLAGFSPTHRDRVNRILNMGSATRFDDVSDTVTHVIVGDAARASADLRCLESRNIHSHVLTIQWLEESIKLKRPAPEEPFALNKREEPKKPEPPSPLSKKNLQMLQKTKRPPVPVFKVDQSEEDEDLVRQYLQPTVSDRTLESHSKTLANSRNDSEVPFSQSTGAQIFRGLTFLVTGLVDEDDALYRQNIVELGGRLLPRGFTGVADYAIVPVNGVSLRETANEIVTNLFIEDCLDNEAVLDIQYYHRPISIPESAKPLRDCVVVVSSYSGMERVYLSKLAVALGAVHQDTFARRTNAEKGLYAGTHLICTQPEGNKYSAAVKWRLPAVTAEWLRACAEQLRLVDEGPYLVGETMAPERENNPPQRQYLTPRRLITQPNAETPIINKRLTLNSSGNVASPLHFATPETPYGQVFKPNPSPDTRKFWGKFIDQLPEKPEEQQAKKRRLSTPLSEIKRQLWDAMKRPNDETEDEEPVNRELSFNGDTSKKAEIHQELQEMEKLFKATSSGSGSEDRFSIHGDEREKIKDNCDIPMTQPESVGWEDPRPPMLPPITDQRDNLIAQQEEEEEEEEEDIQKKFMLSGVKDRASYEAVIRRLGGEVSQDSAFDDSATHLLCVRPSRNEKMLGSIAAGKWILHVSYLRASESAGKFVYEEPYEWGNRLSVGVIPKTEGEQEPQIAAAAHRWRVKLERSSIGAFDGMVALLMVCQEKYDTFARLVKAGGGVVVQVKPPYDASPSGRKITHCFITKGVGQPVDWAMLASKGVLCFHPQYLNHILTTTEPINPRDHVLPEFKKYLALLPK